MSDALSLRPVDSGDPSFVAPLNAVDDLRVATVNDRYVVHASKRVHGGDPYMAGHFPSLAIYPGVFILETVRQAVALAVCGSADIAALRSVRFLAPLFEDDVLTVEATIRPLAGGLLDVDARCARGDGRQAARLRLELRRS